MGSDRSSELWRTLGPAIGKAISKHARFRWEEDGTPAVSTAIDLGAITDAAVAAIKANPAAVLDALGAEEGECRFCAILPPPPGDDSFDMCIDGAPHAFGWWLPVGGASGETDHPEGP